MFHTVLPVAPLTVQSATSHGLTFHIPLMATEVDVDPNFSGVAIDGRPADCVKLALSAIWNEKFAGEPDIPDRPDLVLSGINAGANCGINTIYSGTVAAALEAAFLGVPSVALSLHLGRGKPDWKRAGRIARRVLETLLGNRDLLLRDHVCLNVNIPVCDSVTTPPTPEEPEIVVRPMNTFALVDNYERRESPAGDVYYWSAADGLNFIDSAEHADVAALMERKITVTPIGYDLTRHAELGPWIDRLERTHAPRPAAT
jgi:5'-nucleotidase